MVEVYNIKLNLVSENYWKEERCEQWEPETLTFILAVITWFGTFCIVGISSSSFYSFLALGPGKLFHL
jgi:hypothetical protein